MAEDTAVAAGSPTQAEEAARPTQEGASEGSRLAAMLHRREVPPWVVSLIMHSLVLLILGVTGHQLQTARTEVVTIDTRITPEREPVEFPQVLDTQEVPAETLNIMPATGVPTDQVGSSPAIRQVKVEQRHLPDAEVKVNVAPIDLPGRFELGTNVRLGLDGEIGAIVGDYGTALDRLSQEILRLLRESGKVLVVWLFDESGSMTDDQQEIKNRFDRVYRELGLVDQAHGDALLTSVISFGKELHVHTKEPTYNLDEIRTAIDQIPVDESGTENMCQTITQVVKAHRRYFTRGGYRLAVVVLSDESGDDGQQVEQALQALSRSRAPLYILGREAVFGSPTAYLRWIHPETGLSFWRPIRRGPETADVEQLQYDGFRSRYDAHNSGFGAYEQSRLARGEWLRLAVVLLREIPPTSSQHYVGEVEFDDPRMEQLKALVQYHTDLQLKYENAAIRSWLPVRPDPSP